MEDNPTVFLKRIVTITLGLAVILAGVLYFSRPDDASNEVAGTPEENGQEGIYQSDIDAASASGAAPTGSASKPKTSVTLSASNELIRKAEQIPPSYGPIVYYDNDGFHPSDFRVNAGTSIRFINRSSASMRVSSVNQAGATVYPEFDSVRSVGRGGYYDFNFSKRGAWTFQNANVKKHYGSVIVQ